MSPPDTRRWVEAILERFEKPLLRYAATLLGDPEEARDSVQETFLRLSREDRMGLDERIAPWLFTVCRNVCMDRLRQIQRIQPMDETTFREAHSQEMSPDDSAAHSEAVHTLSGLLATLPATQREVVRLKFDAGLSYREISEVTQLSVTNVGFILHTAIKNLRDRWPRESLTSL